MLSRLEIPALTTDTVIWI